MEIDVTMMMQMISYLVIAVSCMAFIVSVVTQVIKSWPGLEGIPTKAVVIVLSLVICPVAMVAAMSYLKYPIEWYMVFACMLAAFVVALVAMDGWECLKEIWDRSKSPKFDTTDNNI